MTEWNFQRAVEYIENIPRFTKEKSEVSRRLILEHFGNPQESFHYIHVAGTNGKGSVCAYIDSMLREAGVKTGLFTSPHLVSITERMRVDGRMISEDDFTKIFSELYEYVAQQSGKDGSEIIHPTYFEWLYIMSMIFFSREDVEYGVIETGLGGRLDATNTVIHPDITIITSISYDHTAILGDTLSKIAAEKAGIIKEGVPVICDGSEPEAVTVIREKAHEMRAPLTICFNDERKICETGQGHSREKVCADEDIWLVKNILNKGKNIDFYLEEMYHEWDSEENNIYHISLGTGARYQAMNSSLAVLAVHILEKSSACRLKLSYRMVFEALRRMRWPGRLEEIMPGIIVDGAHNVGGAASLRESLVKMYPGTDMGLLFAVAGDKDHRRMISILSSLERLRYVVVTSIHGSRAADISQVACEFRASLPDSVPVMIEADTGKALAEAAGMKRHDMILVCTGSLYLVGDILDYAGNKLNISGDINDQF